MLVCERCGRMTKEGTEDFPDWLCLPPAHGADTIVMRCPSDVNEHALRLGGVARSNHARSWLKRVKDRDSKRDIAPVSLLTPYWPTDDMLVRRWEYAQQQQATLNKE